MSDVKVNGLVIDRYTIKSPEDKNKVPKGLSGWKSVSYTPEEWIKNVFDAGHIAVLGDMNEDKDQTYRHKKELWVGTQMIALDWDRISYEEDDGKVHEGIEPFQDLNEWWRDNQDQLSNDLYALGQSVSTMQKGNPKHRRLRAYVLLENPITDQTEYEAFLVGMSKEYPICSDDRRSPAQPIFGFSPDYSFEKDVFGEWGRKDSGTIKTHILGTVMLGDRMQEIIQLGMPEEKPEPEMPEPVIQKPEGVQVDVPPLPEPEPVKKPTENLHNPLREIGSDPEFARGYLESKGSTFVRDDGRAYHFTKNGGKNGEVHEAILYDSDRVGFYSFSENSWFVTAGYAEKQVTVPFSDLFWDIEYPGMEFREVCKKIIDQYPQYDTGWRPVQGNPKDMFPIRAIDYMHEAVEGYINRKDPGRPFKQIEPGWDDRYIVFLPFDGEIRQILFSNYWAYMEGLLEQYKIITGDYDTNNPDHRRAFAEINNAMLPLTGETGGWKARKPRKRKSKYTL